MSLDPGALELLGEAHAAVIEIQESLTNPTAATLGRSLPLFERAADRLRRLHVILREGAAPGAELRTSALGLQKEVARLRVLLEAGASFRVGWMRRLGAQVAGYTPQGVPSPLAGGRRVLAEG